MEMRIRVCMRAPGVSTGLVGNVSRAAVALHVGSFGLTVGGKRGWFVRVAAGGLM